MKQRVLGLIGFVLAGLLCWALIVIARLGFETLSKVNPTVLTGMIAGAATILVSVLSVTMSRYYESRSLVLKEHREKKMPVYEELMAFLFRVVYGSKMGNELSEKEMVEFFASFTQKFMIWGSDDVVREYVVFRRHSISGDPVRLLLVYENLVRAIRQDLGHSNKGLKAGDILSMFVNDVESVLKKSQPVEPPQLQR